MTPPRVLVVDDDPTVRATFEAILSPPDYRCRTVASATEARVALSDEAWDLLLCDVVMPETTGTDLLRYVAASYPRLPVVMVSGIGDVDVVSETVALGAYGYITKPFTVSQVLVGVANAIERSRLEEENLAYRNHLETLVEQRTVELSRALEDLARTEEDLRFSSEEMVAALARAIEGRDVETGHHIERMSHYTEALARWCGLSEDRCMELRLASPMHDVGKIGIPDGILFKPGPLNAAEFEVVKQHASLGAEILSKSDRPLLKLAATIAASHHERWDGTGYPLGLSGDAIPLEGRIVAVADAFDALLSRRVYKPAFSWERSLATIGEGRATQFDPNVVDTFFSHLDELRSIHEEYRDE